MSPEQTGYIKNKLTGTNTVLDIAEQIEKQYRRNSLPHGLERHLTVWNGLLLYLVF